MYAASPLTITRRFVLGRIVGNIPLTVFAAVRATVEFARFVPKIATNPLGVNQSGVSDAVFTIDAAEYDGELAGGPAG
jgi:hypothetical protein